MEFIQLAPLEQRGKRKRGTTKQECIFFFKFSKLKAIEGNKKVGLIFDKVMFAELKDENY